MPFPACAVLGRLFRVLLVTTVLALLQTSSPLLSRAGATVKSNNATTATAFITLLVKGDFATAEGYFDPVMKAALPRAQLQQTWQSLVQQLGAFEKINAVSAQTNSGVESVLVACTFAHATADLVVSLNQAGKIGGLHVTQVAPKQAQPAGYSPPSYVNTASFHEQAVTVGSAPWALPGTLTVPKGKGPFPAVVLVAGSGPEDQDETIGPNKPFRDLAWGLASQGIAVLRYDKRTLVYGSEMAKLRTLTVQDEYLDDAQAALQLLAHTPSIDSHHIYLLGHSEGGMVAPRIAQQNTPIAGLILLAAPTRPLPDIFLSQYTYLESRGFATAAQVAAVKQEVAAIKALTPADRGQPGNLLGAPPSYWLDLESYHPAAVAQQLTVPMLILQGARDYQVTLADFNGWKTALRTHHNVQFHLYPNLFHLFMPVPPGSPAGLATPNAYNTPGHVDAAVVHDIVAWLKAAAAP
jgi:dienelactone hydrolase